MCRLHPAPDSAAGQRDQQRREQATVHNLSDADKPSRATLFTGSGWQHVLYRHVSASKGVTMDTPEFSRRAKLDEIEDWVQTAAHAPGHPNARIDRRTGRVRNGMIHSYTFQHPVGSKGEKSIEVVLNTDGSLRTAYPKAR